MRSRVQEVVNINQMDKQEGEDGTTYEWGCRCGGHYCIQHEEILDGFDVVQCDGCSFSIEIKCFSDSADASGDK